MRSNTPLPASTALYVRSQISNLLLKGELIKGGETKYEEGVKSLRFVRPDIVNNMKMQKLLTWFSCVL